MSDYLVTTEITLRVSASDEDDASAEARNIIKRMLDTELEDLSEFYEVEQCDI